MALCRMQDPSPLSNTTVGTPGVAVPEMRTISLWPSTSTSVVGAATGPRTIRQERTLRTPEQQGANPHGHDFESFNELADPETLMASSSRCSSIA